MISFKLNSVKNLPAMQEICVWSLGWKVSLGKGWLPTSCLENSLERRAWWATVHGIPKSRIPLRTNTFIFFLFFTSLEAPSPNVAPLGVSVSTYEFARDTNIQCITLHYFITSSLSITHYLIIRQTKHNNKTNIAFLLQIR